jgi:hypothetical protein
MAYFPTTSIKAADSPSIDAFDRLRVSNPVTLFDASFQYDTMPYFWETIASGTASSATHLPNEASIEMTVGAEASASCARQTYEYYRYQPGKSQLIFCTFVLGESKPNVVRRVGYFDAADGVFLESSETLKLVRRSSATGTVNDTPVDQSSWNIDKFDGTGPSKVALDISKSQILVIDLEWLGVGRVRMGFVIDGIVYYAHQFVHANLGTSVYMATANLPLRYEIRNTTGTASSSTLKQICSTVISEGGFDEVRGMPNSAGLGASTRSINARQPIMGIRPKRTFGPASKVNRSQIRVDGVNAHVSANSLYWQLVYKPDSTVGSAWVSAGTQSTVEFDVSATAINGGYAIETGYLFATGGGGATRSAAHRPTDASMPITLNAAGSNPSSLFLVGTGIGGAAVTTATMSWTEIY